MHFHVELIMPPPPSFDIKGRMYRLLAPLSKDAALRGDITTAEYLYDWCQIGGRYAGTKMALRLDPERLRQFREELHGEAFNTDTRSTVIGRHRFWGTDQLPKVDALWQKWFPEDEIGKYPLTGHYPTGDSDICRVDRIPDNLHARTVVVANKCEVVCQYKTKIWDSTKRKFRNTGFDGSVLNALRQCRACGVDPAPDWLAVTLDCHW